MKVLITGASSGIGAALARHYARRGDHVWLAARRADRLADEVASIRSADGTAHAVPLDIEDAEALEPALLELDTKVGGFDAVIANAGVGGKGTTASRMRYHDVKKVLAINFTGAIATLLAAQQPMLARGRGHLVAVSSLAAELALPIALDYGAAKAGLSYFTEAMRLDLAPRGVQVTLVHPGFVKSEMTAKNRFPMPFILDTDEAAALIVRGVDRGAARVRFPLAYVAAFALAKRLPLSLVAKVAQAQAKPASRGAPRLE
ncbi:MAG: SDR family NAD(P)-dependent oxidoreductase [Deltaproteobacteria bacterium]|nr:SDR family NAD(P)-dependent oxidoreductase [Deltaproteobacteria bacterium]